MLKLSLNRTLVLSAVLALSACANKSDMDPMVKAMEQQKTTAEVIATDEQPGKPVGALVSEVTLNKSVILGQTYNYSSSLQFSSIVDGDISTAMMGLSLGEVPAKFIIVDDKLRLITDASLNFESDVNHPSRLVLEFPILKQDAKTITVRADRASPILDTFMFGNKNKVPVRYSFLRSMEYVEADDLTMIESSVELVDGSLGEFMESIRPRSKTVPADYKVIYNDADLNPLAARYDFLDSGDIYVANPKKPDVRIKTKAANRWVLANGEAVKWYITKNVPDAYINDVKNAVEGWNRYSRAEGKPDLIKFMGRLPDGVKVGDPRYNLIIWDTVQDAGAAYESQNADPVTGIQSHSMIYIPLAWVNIGKDYWNKMSPDSQSPGEARTAHLQKLLKDRSFMGRALPVNCVDNADLNVSEESGQNPEQFARGLLKGVVFHEVGHSFGLAHDFKGSLSFDADDAKKAFSTSIMDYNHYNEEEAAFSSLDSSDGMLLEYDRQIISVLYNEGKGVKESDPKLPACDDSVADSVDGGVDPLCIRYDIGADVTKEALKALSLFTEAGKKRGKMESITAKKVVDALKGMKPADSVKTEDDLVPALLDAQAKVAGVVGLYMAGTANSFGYLGSSSMKVLKVFKDDVLPDGYDEAEMRDRAVSILDTAVNMDEFPALTQEALAAAKPAVLSYISSTAFVAGLPRDGQDKVMATVDKLVDKLIVKGVQTSQLSKMRTRFINALASTAPAPLAFIERDGKKVDLEVIVMSDLAKLASEKTGSVNRPMAERKAALTQLKSYARSENFAAIQERVVTSLKAEIQASTDALRKEALRSLLADFSKKSDD